MATEFQSDWRSLLPDIHFPEPKPYRLYEQGDLPQLASDRPAAPTRMERVPLGYRLDRLIHGVAFEPGSRGFRLGARVYGALESSRLMRPAHALEQAVKIPLFDCRDCGDCSLPDIAYQCPEGACAKNQRNGPCGGSLDGECEVPGKPCIWAVAYDRLRPYGEAMTMLDRAPVIGDNALRGTSAWANTFLGRDHNAREDRGGEA